MGVVIHIDGDSGGGGGTGTGYIGIFTNYNALIAAHPTAPTLSVAYVQNSQGTAWLPGGMGGTFYSKGTYLFDGVNWVDGLDEVSDELQNLIDEQYKVNVSGTDTTANYLTSKIIDGLDITRFIGNPGANENLTFGLTQRNRPKVTNVDPTVNDDDTSTYRVGQIWINDSSAPNKAFICKDLSVGAAVWDEVPLTADILTLHSELTLDDGTNPHGTTKTDVGLSNVDNLQQIPLSQKAAASGVASLNGSSELVQAVPDNSITNAKAADMTGFSVKVKPTTGTGDPTDLVMASSTILARLATGNVVAASVSQIKTLLQDRLIENATVTGSYAIDYSLGETWNLTLTGNTTFTESNLPAAGFSKVITLRVTGNFTITPPAGWATHTKGTYDGTKINYFTIERSKSGVYYVLITQLN